MTISDRLRLAVFIDFDNIEIGVKNTLNASFDAGLVLEALKERGDVISKTAYSDWQRAAGYSRMLTQHAIRMVQRNLTPGGDKNGADINLALDALEMAFTHPHINAFVIVGGDSDFISLVEKLKQYDKKVFVVGGRQFTSGILQRNCHEFIAYENLVGSGAAPSTGAGQRRAQGRDNRTGRVAIDRPPVEQAIPLVTRGLKVLSEREQSPQLGLLKSTLLQLDSTFSERNYGAGSFRDFVQKLANIGVVRLTPSKGGWLVEPADGSGSVAEGAAQEEEREPAPEAARAVETKRHAPSSTGPGRPSDAPAVAAHRGLPADGVREFRSVLASATIRRWPMYLRNVQQVLRDANPLFDPRAFGFGTVVDLLRAAHRDGVVRVDRDRQGVIRVFQGAAQPAAPVSHHGHAEAVSETASAQGANEPEPPVNAQEGREAALNEPQDAGTPEHPAAEPAAPKPGRRRASTSSASAPRRRRTTK